MQLVPLIAVPNQSLSTIAGDQNVQINVYSLNTPGDILAPAATGPDASTTLVTADSTVVSADAYFTNALPKTLQPGSPAVYFDLSTDAGQVVSARLVRNLIPILHDAGYQGFPGDFAFVDTQQAGLQAGTDPVYTGLGGRYQLVYSTAADIAAGAST